MRAAEILGEGARRHHRAKDKGEKEAAGYEARKYSEAPRYKKSAQVRIARDAVCERQAGYDEERVHRVLPKCVVRQHPDGLGAVRSKGNLERVGKKHGQSGQEAHRV